VISNAYGTATSDTALTCSVLLEITVHRRIRTNTMGTAATIRCQHDGVEPCRSWQCRSIRDHDEVSPSWLSGRLKCYSCARRSHDRSSSMNHW